jgi:hypothetical protein
MKAALLIASLISAAVFASIFAVPAADPQSAPKAFAHGVGYVLPRVLITLICAAAASVLVLVQIRRTGARQTFRQPVTLISIFLLLPAAYTIVSTFVLLSR